MQSAEHAQAPFAAPKRGFRPAIVLAAVALVAAILFLETGTLDDDYIVFRYARNLLEHGELAYNVGGERVEGFTVPLWLALMTAALAVGVAPWIASQVVGIAAACGTVFLIGVLCLRSRPGRFPLPALLLAVSPALARNAVGGLGTTLLGALLVVFAVGWSRAASGSPASAGSTCDRDDTSTAGARRGRRIVAIALALACALRAECVLFVLVYALVERRRRPLPVVLVALAPALGWLAFRLAYFGEWLPNTYYVKRLPPLVDLGYGLRYLWASTLDTGVGLWLAGCVLVLVVPRRGERAGADRWLHGIAAAVLLHAAYVVAVGGDYMFLARFFVPTLPLMMYAAWEAGLRVLDGRRVASRVAAVAALAVALVSWKDLGFQREHHAYNEGRWEAIGKELARITRPADRIAISPIGRVGYFSEREIVDLLGLTNTATRDAAPNLDVAIKGHHRQNARWVYAVAPEIIVPSNGRLQPNADYLVFAYEAGLLTHPDLQSKYRAILHPVEGSYDLVYYARYDVPVPPGGMVVPQR